MARANRLAIAALVLLATAPVGGNAFADAIDGTWCHKDGRHLTIEGPRILTPGGSRIEGRYGRHDFAYVVPAREVGAGATISMVLVDEETIHLTIGTEPAHPAQGPVQVWRRCELTT